MQNERRDFQDRTKRFALSVIRTFSVIPKTAEAQVLGKQMLRSGTSVGANYREAYRRAAKRSSSRSAVILFVSSKRLLTGSNCYSMEGSSRQKNSHRSDKSATN